MHFIIMEALFPKWESLALAFLLLSWKGGASGWAEGPTSWVRFYCCRGEFSVSSEAHEDAEPS